MISDDEQKTASLLCNAAIEARVLGLPEPAMSITGSGAHGIIATMPLYAAYKVRGYSEEMLLRATALSYLVCMYIKEYSGKLSAFCGCSGTQRPIRSFPVSARSRNISLWTKSSTTSVRTCG